MPDRAEANSAIVRCRTRVVPLRTVNKKLRERLAAIGRLLLLLCRRLLRIRGLAASGHQGGPRNDCNDRQFQKCVTFSAPGLLTQITSHGQPFPGLRAPAAPRSTPTRVSSSICPETPAWSKINRARPPRLPAPPTRRRWRRFQGALPDRSVIELNGHAVRGIDRAEIGPGNPQATRVIHPASGWLADLVDQVELPTVLGDEGEARLSRYATRDAPIWARQIHALGRRVGCDHRCRHRNRTQYHFHCVLLGE